jgi:transcriptional regulator with GAF, ATPase, and Fis domain
VIERAAILGNGRRLEVAKGLGIAAPAASALRPASAASGNRLAPLPTNPEAASFDQQARSIIETALRASYGRVDGPFGAARSLGLNPQTLRSRMKKLGIEARRFRAQR